MVFLFFRRCMYILPTYLYVCSVYIHVCTFLICIIDSESKRGSRMSFIIKMQTPFFVLRKIDQSD